MNTISSLRKQATTTADEIADILIEPLYNIDDTQALRIASALLSSGRISGFQLESVLTGVIFDQKAGQEPRWIEPKSRKIVKDDIHLGDIYIEINESEINETFSLYLFVSAILAAMIILGNVAANVLFIRKRVYSAFAKLEEGIKRIDLGSLGHEMLLSGYSDMDRIIMSFNKMSSSLEESKIRVVRLNAELEERVKSRTSELEAALVEQGNLREQLVESAKLSALGNLSAGIAHEINTPLGAIISSSGYLLEFFEEGYKAQLDYFAQMSESNRLLFQRLMSIAIEENRSTALSIASRSEKKALVALLSEMGTPEAEEIAEALADLSLLGAYKDMLSALNATDKPLELLRASSKAINAYRMVRVIKESSMKAATVVTALRSYLHPAEASATIVDVHDEIAKALTLLHNVIKYSIQVQTEFLPEKLLVRVDKLDQVLINLIRNAAQAMNYKGKLILRTRADDSRVIISIIDSGTGIPPEIKDEIFKPFFTTRANGEGMGLGLDICRRLIEKYDGRLSFESEPGHTEFYIDLPRGIP
ncbi:hypothetical protein MASR2M78_35100 [Treponema sp.]